MKINLERLDEGVWAGWKHGIEVKVRPLPVSKVTELQKKATRKKIEFEGGQKVVKKEIDEDEFNRLLQEHLIEDWRGWEDQNDQPIPCTPENIKPICDYFHEFRLFVVMTGKEIEELRQEQIRKEEKNS